MIRLKDAGYSAQFRAMVVTRAKAIYKAQVENDQKGIKPLCRPREMILADRNNMKGQKHSWWKVKDKYNAVMFVPPTPGSVLLKVVES